MITFSRGGGRQRSVGITKAPPGGSSRGRNAASVVGQLLRMVSRHLGHVTAASRENEGLAGLNSPAMTTVTAPGATSLTKMIKIASRSPGSFSARQSDMTTADCLQFSQPLPMSCLAVGTPPHPLLRTGATANIRVGLVDPEKEAT